MILSLFTFFLTKNEVLRKTFFVVSQSVFCFNFFSFIIFHSFFLSSILSFITFSFHLFVHLLMRFSPLSFLSFLNSSFISLSPCFSFFFLSRVSLSFSSIAVLAYLLFVLTQFSFISFVLDLILFSFFFTSSSSSLYLIFVAKNIHFFMNLCLSFWNPAFICGESLVFSSLRRPVALCVPFFLIFRVT